ncbi:MAG: LCP family protein [Patescibacteria group bacterium]|nr:LCP family protein [Patescibacteria group bacterium]
MTEEQKSDQSNNKPRGWQLVFKLYLIFACSILTLVLIALISSYLIIRPKYNKFLSGANLNQDQFYQLVKAGYNQNLSTVLGEDDKLSLLVLGVDSLEQRPGSPALTDTMLLAQIDFNQAQITTLSLPRDLWSEDYQTKINALYTYGLDRYPENPTQFPTNVVRELTEVEIDNTVVLSLEQLAELIDLVEGVEIFVENGFVDKEFPRTDVDVTQVTDPEKLYETVEFKTGTEQMMGERALKYIRSRHSQDDEGTDLARSLRQQQIINALIEKLSQPKIYWHQPELAGKLLNFYQTNFNQYFPTKNLITIALDLGENMPNLEFKSVALSIYPDEENGVIYHPKPSNQYQDQWVYLIKDHVEFKKEIKDLFTDN